MALRRILFALLALLLVIPAAAQADPTFPTRTTEPVVDAAHLLQPDQVAALSAKLTAFEQSTKQQVVVATIPDLQGYDIADYGYQLGRVWGIGQKDVNNGVILIVAPKERRMRIEVGYGLEGVLTDALSARIINQQLRPRFKDGDFAGGINAGVDEIIRIIQLPPEEQQKLAAQASRKPEVNAGDVFKAIIIVMVIFFVIIISISRAAARGGRRYRNGNGISPIVVWAASEALGAALRGGRDNDGGGWGGGGWGGGGGGGGFSGGGGSFGGGGASGGW